MVDKFYSYPELSKPHTTVRYATKKLLELREQKPSNLSDAIVEHIQILELGTSVWMWVMGQTSLSNYIIISHTFS